MGVNRQWRLAQYPEGLPTEASFQWNEAEVPEPSAGQVLVRACYLSVDPYMRGRMRPEGGYAAPVGLGEVMVGGVAGRVVASRNPVWPEGAFVEGPLGWQDYAVSDGSELRLLPPDPALLPLSLGLLGMPGFTAYFGLLDVGRPAAGETVLVSGAAGAVGSVVGQIAKIRGCRAVGIAGSKEKVRVLKEELGFDEAVDYKAAEDLHAALREACPSGVDVYFDNVGGAVTDAALSLLNLRARGVICGLISQYNATRPSRGPRPYLTLLIRRATLSGFMVFDYQGRYGEALERLSAWHGEGKLVAKETVVEGLEHAPQAFLGLFSGQNVGKMLVKVSDPASAEGAP
jgi:NADPH-dependent curcumin reductase CurA